MVQVYFIATLSIEPLHFIWSGFSNHKIPLTNLNSKQSSHIWLTVVLQKIFPKTEHLKGTWFQKEEAGCVLESKTCSCLWLQDIVSSFFINTDFFFKCTKTLWSLLVHLPVNKNIFTGTRSMSRQTSPYWKPHYPVLDSSPFTLPNSHTHTVFLSHFLWLWFFSPQLTSNSPRSPPIAQITMSSADIMAHWDVFIPFSFAWAKTHL